jgi:homocysteine S-methyltransferase
MVTAYTLTDTGEAIGIVHAARDVGLPLAVSFTVETDGRLASGATLAQAIVNVDDTAPPEYFLINCAHPTHVEPALTTPGSWRERIVGIRCNASAKSHAELDDATELDDGDPQLLHRTRPAHPVATKTVHRRWLLRDRRPPRRKPVERRPRVPCRGT